MGINTNTLKSLAYGILGLVVLITLISLLFPSKVLVAKSVQISADKAAVINEISNLRNWKNWHPVFTANNIDADSASAIWQSNGKENRVELTVVDSASVHFLLKRAGENDIENIITVRPMTNSTQLSVEWLAINKLKWYPWEKFAGIFIDKVSGPGYQQALDNFKKYMEGR